MSTNTKKSLSVIAALLLVATLFVALPTPAFADPPDPDVHICAIYVDSGDDIGYDDLGDALADVGSGGMIYLLRDIEYDGNIIINDELTIELRGFDLKLLSDHYFESTSSEGNVYVIGGGGALTAGEVIAQEGASLAIDADIYTTAWGVGAYDASTLTINGDIHAPNNAALTIYDSLATMQGDIYAASGALVGNGSTVTIVGNIEVDYDGIHAFGEDTNVTATGNINAGEYGIYVFDYAEVAFVGNIQAGTGVRAGYIEYTGATVSVIGDILAFEAGVVAILGSDVTVQGNITATDVETGIGVIAAEESIVTVIGDIDAILCAVAASGYSIVEVTGDITTSDAVEGIGVLTGGFSTVLIDGSIQAAIGISAGIEYDTGADVVVTGDILAIRVGVLAQNYSSIEVGGNIIASGAEGVGVAVRYGTEVTVDGTITALFYIAFDDIDKAIGDNDATSEKAGYRQYSDDLIDMTSYVWVKIPPAPLPPAPTTPGTGDSLGLGLLLISIISALGACGFLARRRVID